MNVVVDGSNLSFPSVRGRRPSVRRLATIVEAVAKKLCVELSSDLVVILDSGIRYEFEDHQAADLRRLQSMLGPEHLVACKGRQAADEFVLRYAQEQDALIVSGDEYRDWPALREGQMRLSPVLVGLAVIVPGSVWVMAKNPRDDVEQSLEFLVQATRTPPSGASRTARPKSSRPASPSPPPAPPAVTRPPAAPDGALDAHARQGLMQNGPMMLGIFGQFLRRQVGAEFDQALAAAAGERKSGQLKRYVLSRQWMALTPTASGDPLVSLASNTSGDDRPISEEEEENHDSRDRGAARNDFGSALEAAIWRVVRSRPEVTIGFLGLRLPSYLGMKRPDFDGSLETLVGGRKSGRLARFVADLRGLEIDDATADPIVRVSATGRW